MALMTSSGGTAILGVIFWALAAHVATTKVLGRTSAEIAAMILLANLAELSFGTIFERFLPVTGDETREFVKRAYAMCVGVAVVVTSFYIFVGLTHSFLPSGIQWRVMFVVAVVMWTVFMLQDYVLVGLRATHWVPVENILFAAAKLALLPVLLIVSKGQGIFLAWSSPVIVTIVIVNWYLFRSRIPQHEALQHPKEKLPSTRELFILAGAQYSTQLFSVFTPAIVTLIVISRLGAVANAHFYVPQLILNGLAFFSWSVVRSFIVEATHEPGLLRKHANTAIWGLTAVLIPGIVIGEIFAPDFLRIFGAQYVTHGTALLRMLLLSLPLSAVSIFYSAFAWLDRRVWWMTIREFVSAGIYFAVLFSLIGKFGILSIGIASIVSSGLQGIFFLPSSIRRYRQTSNVN